MISSPDPRDRLDVIQLLRGLAALSVCMLHGLTWVQGVSDDQILEDILKFGSSGVDLFFCISGFVMTYTTRSPDSRSFRLFCVKRFSRIVPVYFILTIAFVLIMKVSFFALNADDPDYRFKFGHVVRSLLFIPLQLSSPSGALLWGGSSLMTGWTLNYEVYFYAIFALSLLFGRARWVVLFSWIALTLIFLPLVGGKTVSIDTLTVYGWHLSYLNLVTSPIIWEFVGGIVACLIYFSSIRFPTKTSAWAGVILSLSFASWFIYTTPANFSLTHFGLPYVVLLTTLVVANKSITFEIPEFFMLLGRISFSIYLVHLIVQGWIGLVFGSFSRLQVLMRGFPFLFFLTTLCVVAAFPVHAWLEVRLSERVRRGLERLFGLRSRERPSRRVQGDGSQVRT